MTTAIPVIDVEAAEAGDRAQLDAVRAGTEELGVVQVVKLSWRTTLQVSSWR
jgi:hypothetical protein